MYVFTLHVTSVPLKFIFGDSISTGVKVFLQGVYLSAQNVPKGFHFCKLLTQPVPLLHREKQKCRDANSRKRKLVKRLSGKRAISVKLFQP